MKTISGSTLQEDATINVAPRSRNRLLMILTAMWHMLRRDMMVTRREFIPFVIQVLAQPLAILLVFGKILPGVGTMNQLYPALFFPGVVALTIFIASLQGITLSLMYDLSYDREIDDRLNAPLPISMVAVEKIIFVSLRTLVAAALTFPLAYVVLGTGYHVRTDLLAPMIGVIVLYALSSAALGLVIAVALPIDKSYLVYTLIISACLYTGCVYFTWGSLNSIPILQALTLTNPLTYASEGFRYTMVPNAPVLLPIGWSVLGLSASFVIFLWIGVRIFRKRCIS
jgi:ABC-2 type transport system permease protein